jgi:hypothetical protein
MRVENPNYYGITVIFNYHSSGSSMYKYLTLITCSMIYQHRYTWVIHLWTNKGFMGDKFGFLSIVDFGATIWYIPPKKMFNTL